MEAIIYAGIVIFVVAAAAALTAISQFAEDAKQRRALEADRAAAEREDQERQARMQEAEHAEALATAKAAREREDAEARDEAARERVAQATDLAQRLSSDGNTPSDVQLDELLRVGMQRRPASGRVLTAMLFSQETGRLQVDWFVHADLKNAVQVVGKLDGTVVIDETAMRGIYADTLKTGRRYTLTFDVFDNARQIEKNLQLTFYMSSPEDVARRPGATAPMPLPPAEQMRAEWQKGLDEKLEWAKWRKAAEAIIKEAGLEGDDADDAMSSLIAERQQAEHEARNKKGAA